MDKHDILITIIDLTVERDSLKAENAKLKAKLDKFIAAGNGIVMHSHQSAKSQSSLWIVDTKRLDALEAALAEARKDG